MGLTGKQKRYLRGLGNQLKATVFIGQNGITDAVLEAIKDAFNQNELIKVKLQEGFFEDRKQTGEELAEATETELVQVLGKTILLYKPFDEAPEIQLPA